MIKRGFTLAEVLITLAIIGVISVLTLPNLIESYQERVMITQLQRNYNLIRTTVANAMTKEGATKSRDLVSDSDPQKNVDFLRNYFEATVACTRATGYSKCLAPTYRTLKDTSVTSTAMVDHSVRTYTKGACVVVSTGATLCTGPDMDWLIDVNGMEKPNKYGKDVFWFKITDEGKPELAAEARLKGYSTFDATRYNKQMNGEYCVSTNDNDSVRATSCFAKVIADGWKIK